MYIPGKLFLHGDAAATAANITSHETLFRIGIAADLATGVLTLCLTLALYRLLSSYGRHLAVLVVVLGGVLPCALYFVNTLNDAAILLLLRGSDILAPFSTPQRDVLISLFTRLHAEGVHISEVFWGLWLLPLAVLTWRSCLLPRFLAIWLSLNGLAYVIQALVGILAPQREDAVSNALSPILFGEIVFMLWLIIKGTKSSSATTG
jgi:hypothetical protein